MVHEIGHAIGHKHPGNYNAGDPTSTVPGNFLGSLEDNASFSMMSYRDATGEQYREWFGVHDLLAPKQLYGSGSPHAGNSIYTHADASGLMLGVINDSGGFDTIDTSRCTSGINLHPEKFSSVGINVSAAAVNNLSIDFFTTVENRYRHP